MDRLLRRARRLALSRVRSGPARRTAVAEQRAGELTYLAVVNGSEIWVTAQVPDPAGARLAVVHRHRKDVRLLPAPSLADMAGQDLPPGSVTAACRSVDVFSEPDTGIWDLAVVEKGGTPRRLPLGAQARLYPAAPVAPSAGSDGVVVRPYRTKDGRGAVDVSVAVPSVEVARLVSEPGRLAMTLELRQWSGPEPSALVLEQRRGTGRLTVPLEVDEGRASITVPLHLLAEECREAPASVWDVAVEGPAGRTRCGRRAHDVSDPRRVYRYATNTYQSANGAVIVFRPYFTNDRHLAVEIDGTEQVPRSA